jgi:hypothetical protein
MSSITAVSGTPARAPAQPAHQPPKRIGPDHDGDNDAGESKTAMAAEAAKRAAHKVNVRA